MTLTIAEAHDRQGDTDPVLLQVSGLSRRYGDEWALADVSFPVRSGEVLGLIGPNGAGKTTLMETIAGTLPSDGGQVICSGRELSLQDRREYLFYLPDGLQPWRDQYASRVLEFFRRVYGRSESFLADTAEVLGLAPVLHKRISALSKGYSRRLMLALALMTPQPIVLMDEPFDGFDLRQTRHIMQVLRDVAGRGRTLVLAIHQLTDAESVCDRFVLLADGRLRGTGTLDELREKTGKPSLAEVFLALT